MSDVAGRIATLSGDQRAALLRRLRRRDGGVPDHSSEQYDVAILGGGVAGLTLALQLEKARPGIRVTVVEKQSHPVREIAHKVGESTVEIAAHYLRDILGLREHLDTRQLRKFGLRMFFSTDDNRDIARRVEMGLTTSAPLPTYQLDRGRLENALAERVRRAGVDLLGGSTVLGVELGSGPDRHRIRVGAPDGEREITAAWVVDATGRRQLLQRQLGLGKKVGHKANAAWFRLGHPVDITDWTDDAQWQARVHDGDRALSTNHLMGHGYWVWLIRLPSDSISVGIVTDAALHSFDDMSRFDRAVAWLHEHEPQCAEAIERNRDTIQDFRVLKNYSYSCEQVFSGEGRWCLTGEAGVFLDPLYSPGIDLIAIGNGLITDLVGRYLDTDDVRGRAAVHDRLFLNVVDIWMAIYEKQYALMGNASVMISKVIWDTAFYWGVFGLLYFHGAFHRLTDTPSVARDLARFTALSNRIQAFFREWDAIDRVVLDEQRFVDLYSPLNFMVGLHSGMAADLSPAQLEARFAENLRLFEQLAGQLISTVVEAYADRPEDRVAFDQIQRWQTEPFTAQLIATHRREGRRSPTSGGWITAGRRLPDAAVPTAADLHREVSHR